jgi:acyl carrier protein
MGNHQEKILAIITRILEKKGSKVDFEITADTRLSEDLGLDSFDLAEMTVLIEDEFGIDVYEDGIIETYGEVLVKIK